MPQKDGFLTLFSLEKGWRDKYTQVKWLWIVISAACGFGLGLLGWSYDQRLFVPGSIAGTVLGAGLTFLFLKALPKIRKKSD